MMTTRRHLLAGAAALAPLAFAFRSAMADEGASAQNTTGHGSGETADFLFVQNARSIVHADGRLTLKGVSPATVMFSDRPERIAGHMNTARFVPFWSEGDESFLLDPPNATLSFLENRDMEDVVLVLQEPELVGDDLSYQVRVLDGTLPAEAGPASLFIDVIGMPLTPVSFAGARRRSFRRAVIY
jgi:hypothetical protein